MQTGRGSKQHEKARDDAPRDSIPAGRWTEIMSQFGVGISTRVAPGTWGHNECGPLGRGTKSWQTVHRAATSLSQLVSSWEASPSAEYAQHAVRSRVLAAAMWFAVSSRNGTALSTLIANHAAVEEALLACHFENAHGGVWKESDRAVDMLTQHLGIPPGTHMARLVLQLSQNWWGCRHVLPWEALDEPSCSERALIRMGAYYCDPLALAVQDLLCEERFRRCLGQMQDAAARESLHVAPFSVPFGRKRHRPDLFDLERVFVACDALWNLPQDIVGFAEQVFFSQDLESPSTGPCQQQQQRDDDHQATTNAMAQAQTVASLCHVDRNTRAAYFGFLKEVMSPAKGKAIFEVLDVNRRIEAKDLSLRRLAQGPFGKIATEAIPVIAGAVWNAAQSRDVNSVHAFGLLVDDDPCFREGRDAEAWDLIRVALVCPPSSSSTGSAPPRDTVLREVEQIAEIVLGMVSLPHLWVDPTRCARSNHSDPSDTGSDCPPIHALAQLALLCPGVALAKRHRVAMARILANMRSRLLGRNNFEQAEAKSHADFLILDADNEPDVLKFDAVAWATFTACCLADSSQHRRFDEHPWKMETEAVPFLTRSCEFARILCEEHKEGRVKIYPSTMVSRLKTFANNADPVYLVDSARCKDLTFAMY
ncbi:hypothetical protein ml_38 [Mollivirus sibericum]|uniref:hypothetical protein n=1 Tax=Mollivirus sibericum TaxID=1678078 RepID=UPI0006B2D95A|nr:hypothetical protein ml_38 [Mollivirus sibericum]ALD61840.1 hypothetical protein ml_38 [Mollivirus sibericum]